METERCYIDFLNKDKKFKQERKYFQSFEDAVKWGKITFDKFNFDMVNYGK